MKDQPDFPCDICLHGYDPSVRVPLILKECGHCFCSVCLSIQFKMNRANKIVCSVCRKITHVDSVNQLKKNYEVLKVIERVNSFLESSAISTDIGERTPTRLFDRSLSFLDERKRSLSPLSQERSQTDTIGEQTDLYPSYIRARFEVNDVIRKSDYYTDYDGVAKLTERKVALRCYDNAFSVENRDKILREIKLMKFFKHENVQSIKKVMIPKNIHEVNKVFCSLQPMNSDLEQYLWQNQLEEDHIKYFMYQILRGLKYIHSTGVIHRDLRLKNILLNENCEVKISGFHLARGIEKENESNLYSISAFRSQLRAPEVLVEPSNYSMASDIWAVGCIFAELLARQNGLTLQDLPSLYLFLAPPTEYERELLQNHPTVVFAQTVPEDSRVILGSIFQKSSFCALSLLDRMLTWTPETRISLQECLEHPFFEEIHGEGHEPVSKELFDWSFEDQAKEDPTRYSLLVFQTSS